MEKREKRYVIFEKEITLKTRELEKEQLIVAPWENYKDVFPDGYEQENFKTEAEALEALKKYKTYVREYPDNNLVSMRYYCVMEATYDEEFEEWHENWAIGEIAFSEFENIKYAILARLKEEDFNWYQLEEVRAGFEAGLEEQDVLKYAKIKFDDYQMAQIRKDLEKQKESKIKDSEIEI